MNYAADQRKTDNIRFFKTFESLSMVQSDTFAGALLSAESYLDDEGVSDETWLI